MEEPAMLNLSGQGAELHRLTRTDPDPRVRHRADALLVLAHGRSVDEAAHDMGCCTKRIRVWRRRFLAEGRQGLADRPGMDAPRSWMPGPRRNWRAPWPPPRWTMAIR